MTYQKQKNKEETQFPTLSGRFYTMERYKSGYRIIQVTITNGIITDCNIGEYDIRTIQESKIIRNISNDLYNNDMQGVELQ